MYLMELESILVFDYLGFSGCFFFSGGSSSSSISSLALAWSVSFSWTGSSVSSGTSCWACSGSCSDEGFSSS